MPDSYLVHVAGAMRSYYKDFSKYAKGREPSQKVAWVTSFTPIEILDALDIEYIYPESYSAVIAASGLEQPLLEESTRQAVEAKENYDTQAAAYEEKVIELTEAPDLPSYESVLTENAELKEELSLKDRLIDSLREEIDVWKDRVEDLKESVNEWREKVEDWKDRFHGFAEEAGQKIMGYFGYETEDPSISEYPSKEFAEAYDSMKEDVSGIDPKSLRTIPDNEEEGKFRVVQRTDDGYETLRGGFDTRFEAESWQKDLASGVRSLDDNLEEGRSLHR
jgi:hypothetical protein